MVIQKIYVIHLICRKFKAFGLNSFKVDGSDVNEIDKAVSKAIDYTDTATVIVLDTIKGQGVKMIEDIMDNHHVRLNEEQALRLNEVINKLEDDLKKEGELL